MTHYMELLSLDQPYNLILYMVIPMGLAELLVAMEFFTMYHMDSGKNAGFKAVSKFVGIVLGVYFTALVIYFLAKIYPSIKWRGYADVIAIYSYLIGVIPLLAIALLELNLIYKNANFFRSYALILKDFIELERAVLSVEAPAKPQGDSVAMAALKKEPFQSKMPTIKTKLHWEEFSPVISHEFKD